MDHTVSPWISSRLPYLAELLGGVSLQARDQEFERLDPACPWQVERDLELLKRHVPWTHIKRAYQYLLRNPGRFIEAMYEIRIAAMLAPFVDKAEVAPEIGSGKCDLKCEVGGKEIFLEVSVKRDDFPFERKPKEEVTITPLGGRVTVERSFDSATARDDPMIRGAPASQELRGRISEKARQLPPGELTAVVVGAPGGLSLDTESALYGDKIERANEGGWWPERTPNGLFAVSDEAGGTSGLSAVVWMKLAPHFGDVRVYSRLFLNPLAARPFPHDVEELFRAVFDRSAVLRRELERIEKILLEEYHPERVILFGSLAEELKAAVDRIHQWSDIDLAIVKSTPLRFTARIEEIMDLLQPRVGLNVLVFTPEEFDQATKEQHFFVKDEILGKGLVLAP